MPHLTSSPYSFGQHPFSFGNQTKDRRAENKLSRQQRLTVPDRELLPGQVLLVRPSLVDEEKGGKPVAVTILELLDEGRLIKYRPASWPDGYLQAFRSEFLKAIVSTKN